MLSYRRPALAAAALLLVAGAAVIAFSLTGGGEKPPIPIPESFAVTAVPSIPAPQPTSTPVPSDAPIAQLVIPRIKISAAVQVLGLAGDGAMQDPAGPVDVGWYDLSKSYAGFSSYPGWGGNAVFAGHVDYRNYGPAVFSRLYQLLPDDEVEIRLADDTQYKYRVVSLDSVGEDSSGQLLSIGTGDRVDINDIVGPIGHEVVTLITCEGTFNPKTRQYDKRLIVRAERVPS